MIPSSENVACLGSSSTVAKGSFDWIAELQRRPGNRHLAFLRFASGGDLAYNALQRLPDVIAFQPAKAIILIGGNDVLAQVSPKVRRIFKRWKHLPAEPSPENYRENIRAIVQRLKSETAAGIGLCSLCPIGEDLGSADPFQSELNRRVQEYSAIVKETVRDEDVGYIPFYESMREQIAAHSGRAFTSFEFLSFYRDAFRLLVLHRSLDEIAQRNGWRFHTDGVHLNSRGGMILTDLVQEFLDCR